MRVFFGHPKGWEEAVTAEFSATLQREMGAELKVPVTVVTGKNDYEQNAARCGNFNGWCRDVVKRTEFSTGKRVYDVLVVPKTDTIGKATMQIINYALADRVPVVEAEWLDGGTLKARPVSGRFG